MAAFLYDFVSREDQIEIGARWEVEITYYTDDAFATPMSFAGWTNCHAQIRGAKSPTATLLLDFSTAGCEASLSGAVLTLAIDDNVTDTITWNDGFMQVEADDPSGDTFRLLDGKIKTNARVYDAEP